MKTRDSKNGLEKRKPSIIDIHHIEPTRARDGGRNTLHGPIYYSAKTMLTSTHDSRPGRICGSAASE